MPGPKSLAAVDVLLLLTVVIHAIFLSTSTQAQVSHATSRTQLRRRHSKSSASKLSSNIIPSYDWEQIEYVKAHNDLREEANVPPLQWHQDLATSSQMWAMELRGSCDYRSHSKGNNYGENIFWSLYKEFTPADVVKKWHSEIIHFDHVTNLCRCQPETDKCECGHYLNVVWKSTQWVGCSKAVYCNEAKGVIVVCQYDPIGNYKGINPLTHQFTPALQLTKNALKPHHVPTPTNRHAGAGAGAGGGHHAQHSTSISISTSHAKHSTSINISVSHAQSSTSINTSVSHTHNSNSISESHAQHSTTSINNGIVERRHTTSINNDSGYAQDPTSINSDSSVAHVPPPTPINSGKGHAQQPASINTDSTSAHVQPPVNNGIGHAQDSTTISSSNSAAHVPTSPQSPINSGGGNAQHSTSINSGSPATHVLPSPAPIVNEGKSAGHVPPTPPMQSMTMSSNQPPPVGPSLTVSH